MIQDYLTLTTFIILILGIGFVLGLLYAEHINRGK